MGGMSQHGVLVRRSLLGAVAVLSAALMAGCGEGWDVPEPPQVTSSATVTPQGPAEGPAGPVGPVEQPGAEGIPIEELEPYEGWGSMDEAVGRLNDLGIACQQIDDVAGVDPNTQMAMCEPVAVLSYDISLESFETALTALEDETPQYRVVADGDWILACEAAFPGACQRVSEYTGVGVTQMG